MVRLAVTGEPGLVASSIDAPLANGQPNYTLDTLHRLRSQLQPADTLFCLLGADSFLTVRSWHRCAELLVFCSFIVAGRPGFSLKDVHAALPDGVESTGEQREAGYTRLTLSGPLGESSELFLLPDLDRDISATEIRADVAEGSTPQTVLPFAVAEYIRIHGLYRQVEIP
jgi:nicotinate-nucleotide adenylyltransferase